MEVLQDGTTRVDAADIVSFTNPVTGALVVLAVVPADQRDGDAWTIIKDIADVGAKFGADGVAVMESPVSAARKKDRMAEVGTAAIKAADAIAGRQLAHREKVKTMRLDVVGAPRYDASRFWEPQHDVAICARLSALPQPQLLALVRRGIEDGAVLLGPVAYAVVRCPAFLSGVTEEQRAQLEAGLKASSAGYDTVTALMARANRADAAVQKAVLTVERAAQLTHATLMTEAPAVWRLLNEPDLGDLDWLPREYRAAA